MLWAKMSFVLAIFPDLFVSSLSIAAFPSVRYYFFAYFLLYYKKEMIRDREKREKEGKRREEGDRSDTIHGRIGRGEENG